MNIDIPPSSTELLYEHNSLVIPGLGALILEYAPSTIDHVQGLLNPPSKSIHFDNNLVVNDGKLVQLIQDRHQVSTEEANQQVNYFLENIRNQLNKREMVNITGVGRLYRNFENQIQFIPDSTNFNKESFGLPTIKFYPILKKQKQSPTSTPVHIPSPVVQESSPVKRLLTFIKQNTWLPAAAISIGFILILSLLFKNLLFEPSSTSNDIKVNQSPTEVLSNEELTKKDLKAEQDEDAADYEEDLATDETADPLDTESITVNPNQRIAIVSVGVFGNKQNAQRRIRQVYEYGYDVLPEKYVRKGQELTKVGIQFAFETEDEFEETFKNIKERFDNAVVIKKE